MNQRAKPSKCLSVGTSVNSLQAWRSESDNVRLLWPMMGTSALSDKMHPVSRIFCNMKGLKREAVVPSARGWLDGGQDRLS